MTVPSLHMRQLGRTGLSVSSVCFGANPIGGATHNYGHACDFETGVATVMRVLESGVRFLDTAASYSVGESERRIGEAIRRYGGLPDDFVVATKVDRNMTTGDFSGAQVRRSCEQSLERLGLTSVPLLYLHDPEFTTFEDATSPGGAVDELLALRRRGLAGHLGLAGGPIELLLRYLDLGCFEVVLTHNRWTLLDRSADGLLDSAPDRGIAVINAAPFGGGLLVGNPLRRYGYRDAPPELLRRYDRITAECARFGVPVPAAALQF